MAALAPMLCVALRCFATPSRRLAGSALCFECFGGSLEPKASKQMQRVARTMRTVANWFVGERCHDASVAPHTHDEARRTSRKTRAAGQMEPLRIGLSRFEPCVGVGGLRPGPRASCNRVGAFFVFPQNQLSGGVTP